MEQDGEKRGGQRALRLIGIKSLNHCTCAPHSQADELGEAVPLAEQQELTRRMYGGHGVAQGQVRGSATVGVLTVAALVEYKAYAYAWVLSIDDPYALCIWMDTHTHDVAAMHPVQHDAVRRCLPSLRHSFNWRGQCRQRAPHRTPHRAPQWPLQEGQQHLWRWILPLLPLVESPNPTHLKCPPLHRRLWQQTRPLLQRPTPPQGACRAPTRRSWLPLLPASATAPWWQVRHIGTHAVAHTSVKSLHTPLQHRWLQDSRGAAFPQQRPPRGAPNSREQPHPPRMHTLCLHLQPVRSTQPHQRPQQLLQCLWRGRWWRLLRRLQCPQCSAELRSNWGWLTVCRMACECTAQ